MNQYQLLHYNCGFSQALQEYVGVAFKEYLEQISNCLFHEVCELWPSISKVYMDRKYQESKRGVPVHGDFNVANVLIHTKYPDWLKYVDWEWAGL